jgi:hypothetical protein
MKSSYIFEPMFHKKLLPLTQSYELVCGKTDDIAKNIFLEVKKYSKGNSEISLIQNKMDNPHEIIYRNNNILTNIPTKIFVFPTITEWAIIWNNSFLCDGWDSLSYNLTRLYKYKTLHFNSHDTKTTFLPSSCFHYRFWNGNDIQERYVWTGVNDNNKWEFIEKGTVCDFEDIKNYKNKIIKNRLNEKIIAELLGEIGVNPWEEKYYNYNEVYYEINRTKYPETIQEKALSEVLMKQEIWAGENNGIRPNVI